MPTTRKNEIEAIEKSVALYLKEMDAAHAKMAKEQQAAFAVDKKARLAEEKARLAEFQKLIKGIINQVELLKMDVQKSLAETRTDHQAAAKLWLGMGKAPAPKLGRPVVPSAPPAPKPVAAPHWEARPAPPPPPVMKEEAKPFTPPALKEEAKPFTPYVPKVEAKPFTPTAPKVEAKPFTPPAPKEDKPPEKKA
ncbi:MAG: hypothetical protein NTV33_09280 [Coprothermobacterota bacterium]|nr:hypothetical protein [Coprothermobacterota bacterium]